MTFAGTPTTPATPASAARQAIEQALSTHFVHLGRSAILLVRRHAGGLKPEGQDALAEEILQEAARRALQSADEFDPSRRAVPWIMGFVMNVLRENFRKRAERSEADIDETVWVDAVNKLEGRKGASSAVAHLSALDEARSRLRPDHQRILTLAYEEGLDGQQLADKLGMPSAAAARKAKSRALQALRDEFLASGDHGEEQGQ